MPGIMGVITNARTPEREEVVSAMVGVAKHESFHVTGRFSSDELGCSVGWVAHEGSSSAKMPMISEDGNLILILSGETFGPKRLAELLNRERAAGASRFLSELNGWFAGVLVNRESGEVILFNDRFGMHWLYIYEDREAFYFASEAKSILKVQPAARALNYPMLAQLILCDCVLDGKSIFENVSFLPGGSAYRWNRGQLTKSTYFQPEIWENQEPLVESEFYDRVKETAQRIIPDYFEPVGEVALSLTAGLDTRMVLACRQPPPGELTCYTFGGEEHDTEDVRIAKIVAKAAGQEHHVLRLDANFLRRFPALAERTIFISDGVLDVCGSHDLYLNQRAREIARIRMTGKYGSEVLRSHTTFKENRVNPEAFHPDFRRHLQAVPARLKAAKRGNALTTTAFKELPLHEHGKLFVEQSQLIYRSPFLDNALVELMYRAPLGARSSKDIQLRLIRDLSPGLAAIRTDRGVSGDSTAAGNRFRELLQYVLFKLDYYYFYRLPGSLARLDSLPLATYLRGRLLERHKFERYRVWFRDRLSGFVKEVLLDPTTLRRDLFNRNFLERMVKKHTAGEANFHVEINKVLTLELIMRQFGNGLGVSPRSAKLGSAG